MFSSIERALRIGAHRGKEPQAQIGTALENYCKGFPTDLESIETRLRSVLTALSNPDVTVKRFNVRHGERDRVCFTADQQGRLVIIVHSVKDKHIEKPQCGFVLAQGKRDSTWTIVSFQGREMSCVEQCQHVFRTIVLPVLQNDCQAFTQLGEELNIAEQVAQEANRQRVSKELLRVTERAAAIARYVRQFNPPDIVPLDPDDIYT